MASFKSFLSAIGHDFVKTLTFLGSKQGQAIVATAEVAANVAAGAVNPALPLAMSGIEGLVNSGIQSAVAIEANAAAVGAQSGTGTQKAAAVTASLTSQAGSFLQAVGVPDATDAEVQSLATAVGTSAAVILNAIPARAAGTAAPQASAPAAPAA